MIGTNNLAREKSQLTINKLEKLMNRKQCNCIQCITYIIYSLSLFIYAKNICLNTYKDGSHREMACLKITSEVLLYASIIPIIEPQMNKINLWNYYITIEMPALNIILQMLLDGILINREELIYIREDLLVNIPSFYLSERSSILLCKTITLDQGTKTWFSL
ncbi:unnamed protein product [Rotaria sp. Silwood2]|nr:unnamed protein product [Rotaria sp. Silwood2]